MVLGCCGGVVVLYCWCCGGVVVLWCCGGVVLLWWCCGVVVVLTLFVRHGLRIEYCVPAVLFIYFSLHS